MLAVVIPYYNIAFFERTIQSLASQTDKRFRVYIGDDASPNNPCEIVAKFQSQIAIEYRKFETNLGAISLVKQWQRCIDLIQNEEWIMVLGDDDVLDSNCISLFYNCIDKAKLSDCKVIRYASQYIDEYNELLKGYFPYYHPEVEKATDSYFRNLMGESRSSLSEHIFLRTTYEKYFFYDYPLAWHSDDRAWLEFSEYQNIFTINEAMVSVRVSQNSITGKKDNVALKNKATLEFYQFLIAKETGQHFTRDQREFLILEFAHKLKLNNTLNFKVAIQLINQLLKSGFFLATLKLCNRYFRFKFYKK